MSYTSDWLNTTPVDHTKFNQAPAAIRSARLDTSERLQNIFYGFISGETQTTEGVKNLPFYVQGSNPSATADKIKLYGKDISSKVELHGVDEDGNIIIITKSGKLAILGSEGWRSGDSFLSSNTSTPTGWTDLSSTYNDKFIRISSGTPLTTGGADSHTHGAGSYTTPSHDHGGSTGGVASGGGAGELFAGPLDTQHYHTIPTQAAMAITGTSASSSNVPVFVQMKAYSKT